MNLTYAWDRLIVDPVPGSRGPTDFRGLHPDSYTPPLWHIASPGVSSGSRRHSPAQQRRHTMRPTPADPEAWNAYLAEGNATQARKRVSADVLLRDESGRVLLVKPTYKPGWDLPGGMVEANEAPDDAARRELKEELGLDIVLQGLLVVDWVPPHGPWDDQLAFIFDGGTLTAVQIAELRPHDGELSALAFVALAEALQHINARLARRLRAAMGAKPEPTLLRDGCHLGYLGPTRED